MKNPTQIPYRQVSRVIFHHHAVVESDPVLFAEKLGKAENDYVAAGWTLTSMINRGEHAVILNMQREEAPPTPVPLSPVLAEATPSVGYTEVIYSFLEYGTLRRLTFPCMRDAVVAVREQIGEERFVPNKIIVMSVVEYEPLSDLTALEKMYGNQNEV